MRYQVTVHFRLNPRTVRGKIRDQGAKSDRISFPFQPGYSRSGKGVSRDHQIRLFFPDIIGQAGVQGPVKAPLRPCGESTGMVASIDDFPKGRSLLQHGQIGIEQYPADPGRNSHPNSTTLTSTPGFDRRIPFAKASAAFVCPEPKFSDTIRTFFRRASPLVHPEKSGTSPGPSVDHTRSTFPRPGPMTGVWAGITCVYRPSSWNCSLL